MLSDSTVTEVVMEVYDKDVVSRRMMCAVKHALPDTCINYETAVIFLNDKIKEEN